MRAGWGAAVAALWLGACGHHQGSGHPDVSYTGPRLPSRGPNCALQVFFATLPPYLVTEIASTRARCSGFTGGRDACVTLIRERACEAGADTVFGFSEAVGRPGPWNPETTYVTATLAVRAGGPPVAPATGPTAAAPPRAAVPASAPAPAAPSAQSGAAAPE